MNLFNKIKIMIKFRKEFKESIKKSKEKEMLYLSMSNEDMAFLSDDELFAAVLFRTEQKVDSFDEWEDGINALNNSQKIFYSISWFDLEINNGGLCQFFVNSSRLVAPYVSEYMRVIGANNHKNLFDKFISDNNIDLNNLSSFDIDDVIEYEKQTERYHFDDFDYAFCNLEPLESYLKKFARENLKDF